MRVLVTGAGGFLGGHVVDELLRRGDDVGALVRPSSQACPRLRERGVELIQADLRRPGCDLGAQSIGYDAILHLAAGVGDGWRATFETNVLATERLISALSEASWKGRFVHVSSFAVYGFNQVKPRSVIDENTALEPEPGRRDDYAWTKLLQERVVRRLDGRAGVELTIVRPGAIYGRGREFQWRLGRPLGERVLLLLGGGNRIPLNYVANTASLLVECAHNPAAAGEVFNAVDPEPLTQRDYLRAWRRAEPIRVIPFPLTLYRVIGRVLETARDRRTGGQTEPPMFLDPYVMEPTLRQFQYDTSRPTTVLGWQPPVCAGHSNPAAPTPTGALRERRAERLAIRAGVTGDGEIRELVADGDRAADELDGASFVDLRQHARSADSVARLTGAHDHPDRRLDNVSHAPRTVVAALAWLGCLLPADKRLSAAEGRDGVQDAQLMGSDPLPRSPRRKPAAPDPHAGRRAPARVLTQRAQDRLRAQQPGSRFRHLRDALERQCDQGLTRFRGYDGRPDWQPTHR